MITTLSETEQALSEVGWMLYAVDAFMEVCGPLEHQLSDVDMKSSLISLQSTLHGVENYVNCLEQMRDVSWSEQTVQAINFEVFAIMWAMKTLQMKSSSEISTSEMQMLLAALDQSLSHIYTRISSELGMLN